MLHDELESWREKIRVIDERIEFWAGVKDRSGSANPGYRQACIQLPLLRSTRAHLAKKLEECQPQIQTAKSPVKAPWHESAPEILKRRQIVLMNPKMSAASFVKLFDHAKIPLPSGWEDKFGETEWVPTYKNKQACALIQKLISTDKKRG